MKLVEFVIGLIALPAIISCQKNEPSAILSDPAIESAPPTNQQPKLRTIKLWIGSEELISETALTAVQMQTGMMYRTNLDENEAMLFAFPFPHRASFWMKNTSVPLSAAYIDPEGVILEIHDLQPHNTNAVLATSDNVQYVLETTQGWFRRKNIQPGIVVRSEAGPLKTTFVRR